MQLISNIEHDATVLLALGILFGLIAILNRFQLISDEFSGMPNDTWYCFSIGTLIFSISVLTDGLTHNYLELVLFVSAMLFLLTGYMIMKKHKREKDEKSK